MENKKIKIDKITTPSLVPGVLNPPGRKRSKKILIFLRAAYWVNKKH